MYLIFPGVQSRHGWCLHCHTESLLSQVNTKLRNPDSFCGADLKSKDFASDSKFHYLLAMCSSASYVDSLCLNFLIFYRTVPYYSYLPHKSAVPLDSQMSKYVASKMVETSVDVLCKLHVLLLLWWWNGYQLTSSFSSVITFFWDKYPYGSRPQSLGLWDGCLLSFAGICFSFLWEQILVSQ